MTFFLFFFLNNHLGAKYFYMMSYLINCSRNKEISLKISHWPSQVVKSQSKFWKKVNQSKFKYIALNILKGTENWFLSLSCQKIQLTPNNKRIYVCLCVIHGVKVLERYFYVYVFVCLNMLKRIDILCLL